jgi:lipopolysaccharide export LptBFGC system permease protein LptF
LRFPWILWYRTLSDLARQVLVISLVLTVVIAFAMAVKFLAEGKVSPLIAMKIMLMATVPMLQYSIPFAAAFGATLVYHRMSQDNELAAAYAGGIGHRVLLVPALVTGLVLAGVVLVLSQQVIPVFLRRIEREVSQDAAKIVEATIQDGRALEFGDWIMIADSVRSLGPHDTSGAYQRLLLTGVVFVEADDQGNLVREGSAATGRVYFFSGSDAAAIEAGTRGAIFSDESRAGTTLVRIELERGQIRQPGPSIVNVATTPISVRMPGEIKDDPKFLTYRELRNVPKNPDVLAMIDQRRRDLAVHLALRLAGDRMFGRIRDRQTIQFIDRAGRLVWLQAGGMVWNQPSRGWVLSPPTGQPMIEVKLAGAPGRNGSETGGGGTSNAMTLSRSRVTLIPDIGRDRESRALTFTLDMTENKGGPTEGAAVNNATGSIEQALGQLTLVDAQLQALEDKSSSELLAMSEARMAGVGTSPDGDTLLAAPTRDLRLRLQRLFREVTSKHHERLAISIACLVMVLTGAVTAMRLGRTLQLVVYLWCFFPALGTLVTIATGQQLTHHQGYGGLVLLWAGVMGLVAYSVGALRLVERH